MSSTGNFFFYFFYGGSYPRAAPFSEEAPCLLPHSSLWSFETPAVSGALGRTDLQTPPPCPGLPGKGPVCHGEQHLSVTAAGSHLCLAAQGKEPNAIGVRVYIIFCYYYYLRGSGNLELINLGL